MQAPPPPDPDADLNALITKHNLVAFWKCVNVKLHARSVSDLAGISTKLLDKAITEFPATVKYTFVIFAHFDTLINLVFN